jgi:hypothetical protein
LLRWLVERAVSIREARTQRLFSFPGASATTAAHIKQFTTSDLIRAYCCIAAEINEQEHNSNYLAPATWLK